jgi:hypothetical protein
MTTFETIVRELASAPEPLLLRVLSFIRLMKDNSALMTDITVSVPRVPGVDLGHVWIGDDFNEPLPDSFWLGEDE